MSNTNPRRLSDTRRVDPLGSAAYTVALPNARPWRGDAVHVEMPSELTAEQTAAVAGHLHELARALTAGEDAAWEPLARREILATTETLREAAEGALRLAEAIDDGRTCAEALEECVRVMNALNEWRAAATLYIETGAPSEGTPSVR